MVLVDSRYTRIYILNRQIEEYNIPYYTKKRLILVRLVDSNTLGFRKGIINLKIKEIVLEVSKFSKNYTYNIINIGELDIILGLDQLS